MRFRNSSNYFGLALMPSGELALEALPGRAFGR
jgi:hypothetical protein